MTNTPRHDSAGLTRTILSLLGGLILGAGIVGYSWETVTELLAGHWPSRRIVTTLLCLAVFVGLLRRIARIVARLDTRLSAPQSHISPSHKEVVRDR